MVKPAGFTGKGESITLLHCGSTLTSDDAVISSNISPYGLIRKWCSGPGTRALMWVKTRSLQPYSGDEAVGGGELHAQLPIPRR